jgi:aspartate dehydrogenase
MNKTALQEILEIEKNEITWPKCNSNGLVDNPQNDTMTVGIIGCGAIANVITDFALEGKLGVDLKFFYDQDMERAENLSSKVDGITVPDVQDMLDHVDLVIEAASQQAVGKIIPPILKRGKDVIIMSVGALIDLDLKNRLESIAFENKSRIYTPSGAIVGLDGIKAASIGNITEVNLITRKPPESLGISTDKETVLYEGKAREAVRKFPMNMNVAATLSIACNMETNVKIIADPEVQHNCHEVHVVGDFGELRTTTQNRSCNTNPKTSVLAAYSAIKLLKSLNENSRIGT